MLTSLHLGFYSLGQAILSHDKNEEEITVATY